MENMPSSPLFCIPMGLFRERQFEMHPANVKIAHKQKIAIFMFFMWNVIAEK
jgi:hypothetical protein